MCQVSFLETKQFCFNQGLNKLMNLFVFSFGRKYLIVSKIQNSGMQKKGACHQTQTIQVQDRSVGLLFSGTRRNGGCRFHVFLQVASLRSQGSI